MTGGASRRRGQTANLDSQPAIRDRRDTSEVMMRTMADRYEGVWVFNGGGTFAGGVFSTLEAAETWISKNRLDGVLTLYPLDTGVYEWAIERGWFAPKREKHHAQDFIGSFTTASMDHQHYERGVRQA
jgi:hypothetical protein